MNIKNSYLTKLVALVLSLGFAQEAACADRNAMQNVELAAVVVGLPVAVLANNAEKSNARSSHVLKIVDDLFVIANQGVSFYNKTRLGQEYKDAVHYKALEILFRSADIVKHAAALAKKTAVVAAADAQADDVEVTAMRKNLIVSATVLRNLVAPVVQAAARGYVALNTEDTKAASKRRLMVESLAFLTNRLSDCIAAPKASFESDAQLVATIAGVVMLLVDYKREIKKATKSEPKKVFAPKAAFTETEVVNKKGETVKVKRSARAKTATVKFAA